MIYKCLKCGSESNDKDCGEWCSDCNDLRVKIIPEKRDYNHDLIFKKYLEDKCPVCDGYVDGDSPNSYLDYGSKCMAKYFNCPHCYSQYTVGYNRNSQPILSEITINGLYPK